MAEMYYRSCARGLECCVQMTDQSQEKCSDEQITSKIYCDLCRTFVQFSWISPQLYQPRVQSFSRQVRPRSSRLLVSLLLSFQTVLAR